MDTPHDHVGAATEEAMAAWLRRLQKRSQPRPNTPTYNAAYESVYEVLARILRAEPQKGMPA